MTKKELKNYVELAGKKISELEFRIANSKGGGYNSSLIPFGLVLTGYESLNDLKIGLYSYNFYYHYLNILQSKYKIEGLPEHLKVKDFWRYFVMGNMYFFKHEEYGLLFSQGIPKEWDLYNNPTVFEPVFWNKTGKKVYLKGKPKLNEDEFEEIVFTPQRKSLIITIGGLLKKLDYLYEEIIRDINVSRSRLPIHQVSADDTTAEGIEEALNSTDLVLKISKGDLFSNFNDQVTSGDEVKPFEFINGTPRIVSDILPAIEKYTNDLYELLGLSRNENNTKKERMLDGEIKVNNESKRFLTLTIYDTLKDGFDRVNKMFGTSIKVIDTEKEMENSLMTGEAQGGNNGNNENNEKDN